MDKLNGILKNTLLFLVIFLVVNYILTSFQKKDEIPATNNNEIILQTTKDEFSRTKTVTVEIENKTKTTITVQTDCPNEPLDVFKYENKQWTQKTASPKITCTETEKKLIIAPGEKKLIPYTNWNHKLFYTTGKYKISFETIVDGKEKTIESNEFTIKKEGIITMLWNGLFYKPIYNGLIFLIAIIPGHYLGIAILLLTLIIRTIVLIPSQKAMKAQKRMQEVQPKLDKIKEKYKNDQQKVASETMKIWKEEKVNPMGSCFPLLLQFPFLISIFYVVKNGLNPDNVYMLYANYNNFSLDLINPHFLGIDLRFKNATVLPLIVGGLQFIQMKLTMLKPTSGKKEKANDMAKASGTMSYIMPVMIAVFTAGLPAGVGIYWGTSTLYGIVQQYIVNKRPTTKSKSGETKVRVIHK